MPVSHELKLVFVHIPKTGGTSIEQALELFGSWRIEDRERLFGQVQSADLLALGLGTRYLQHLTSDEIGLVEPRTTARAYQWFSVVRNPWDRFVSTYLRPDPDLVEQARADGVELTGLEFPEFVERTQSLQQVHLRPQHEFLPAQRGSAPMLLGRFESLDTDFQRACQRLGITRALPHANRAPVRSRRPYRDFYTADTAGRIAARYARDIAQFGYQY